MQFLAAASTVKEAIGKLAEAGIKDEDPSQRPAPTPGKFLRMGCIQEFLADDLKSCAGRACLSETNRYVCTDCAITVEGHECLVIMRRPCANEVLQARCPQDQ